jgi:hypothetical protein
VNGDIHIILKMEAVWSSETVGILPHNYTAPPEDHGTNLYRRENHKFRNVTKLNDEISETRKDHRVLVGKLLERRPCEQPSRGWMELAWDRDQLRNLLLAVQNITIQFPEINFNKY